MKKLILLIAILLPSAIHAQDLKKNIIPSFEIRVGQGMEFYSERYRNYTEMPRTSVLLQTNYKIFILGVGYDYIHLHDGHQSAINVRGGLEMDLGRFSGDTYISAEKIFQTPEPMPTLFGYGISESFRIIGNLNVFADIRAQYPLFQHTYGFNRIVSTCMYVGLKLKF